MEFHTYINMKSNVRSVFIYMFMSTLSNYDSAVTLFIKYKLHRFINITTKAVMWVSLMLFRFLVTNSLNNLILDI